MASLMEGPFSCSSQPVCLATERSKKDILQDRSNMCTLKESGGGERTLWSRALAAIAEDWSSHLSPHTRLLRRTYNSSYRGSSTLFWLQGHCTLVVLTHFCNIPCLTLNPNMVGTTDLKSYSFCPSSLMRWGCIAAQGRPR